jgi:two-component system chemotaxis sensor kinase CheA
VPASDSNETPFVAFIDDYFVECDEHLTVARNSLLALESSVNQTHLDRSLLDELFRSFHSLKGLSAMVGVGQAEQLAHQMESYLSALRKEQVRLTAEGLETLILGVNTLEQVINARRVQRPSPDIEPLLARIAALLPGGSAPGDRAPAQPSEHGADLNPFAVSREKNQVIETAVAAGARAWHFTFIPSPALAERGVNVSAIRQRLQEIGELIHAAPAILPAVKSLSPST